MKINVLSLFAVSSELIVPSFDFAYVTLMCHISIRTIYCYVNKNCELEKLCFNICRHSVTHTYRLGYVVIGPSGTYTYIHTSTHAPAGWTNKTRETNVAPRVDRKAGEGN
jgi:hypothetical protein